MDDRIQKRVLGIADHVLETECTVRVAASVFFVSKSTVHKDIVERLPGLNKTKAQLVKQVLKYNKEQRHIRGGEATRQKFLMMEA